MKKIKICMTTIEFPPEPGGVGQSVHRIARMLAKIGCEVHVVVFHSRQLKTRNNDTLERGFDTSNDGDIHVYRSRASAKTDSNPLPEFLSDVAMEIKHLHEQQQFDVFHAFFMNETGFLTTLVARELGIPVINSVRGADLHKNVFNSKHFSQTLWSLENSSWITFVSRELENRAHVLAPTTRDKTTAFWNSIEPVDFANLPKPKLKASLNGIVISSFGRFRDKKGIDYLIRACRELNKEIELTLLLVGDFIEKEQSYWQQFIAESGMKDNIIITGVVPRDEALLYFSVVDIFAIPSLRDGCPNSMLEAMLAAKAIVGSTVDAIGEILVNNVNGLTVSPADTHGLTDALRTLANDNSLRQRLGLAARNTALDKLSPEMECKNWLNVYQHVLNQPLAVNQHAMLAGIA